MRYFTWKLELAWDILGVIVVKIAEEQTQEINSFKMKKIVVYKKCCYNSP